MAMNVQYENFPSMENARFFVIDKPQAYIHPCTGIPDAYVTSKNFTPGLVVRRNNFPTSVKVVQSLFIPFMVL